MTSRNFDPDEFCECIVLTLKNKEDNDEDADAR